jgi:hypothetical protein
MPQPPKPGQPNPIPERHSTLIEGGASVPQPSRRPPPPSQPQLNPHAYPAVERSGTLVEADDEEQHPVPFVGGGHLRGSVPEAHPVAAMIPRAGRTVSPFRPTSRPPLALLTVYDDGKMEGEVIRIRDNRFTIGRTEGDLQIPIDGLISARHMEITCQQIGNVYRWVITDLQSTNGLFVRVSKTPLADKAEFLVGRGRYRFDAMHIDAGVTTDIGPAGAATGQTRGWGDSASPVRPPALTELIGPDFGNRVLLVKDEYWIGSDPTCPVCRSDDPFCELFHARVHRGSKGNWHVEHNKTQNGLWLRMPQITADSLVQFQIGEQRFRLKIS